MSYIYNMKNVQTSPRPTVANLQSGQVVRAGYKRGKMDYSDANRFVGFKVGDLHFNNLKELKEATDARTLSDIEVQCDGIHQPSATAEWYNVEEGYFWAAYLWNGAFRVGTSADRLSLAAA